VATVGYVIAGILIGTTLVVAAGILGALWLAVSSSRPELLERRRRDG
jgi:predicted outer membrane lipoprotein